MINGTIDLLAVNGAEDLRKSVPVEYRLMR